MFIVGWIGKMLLARGLSQRAAGPLSWVISIVGAALLLAGGWQLVKGSIISGYKTEQRAKTAETQLKRTNLANEVDAGLERRDQDADERLEGAIEHAVDKDPKRGASPVGPVSNATADELRASRGKRQQPPS